MPWALRPAAAAVAVAVLLAPVAWFGAELILGAGQAGLAERAAGAAQAIWPLTVVLSCLAASRRRPVPLPEEAVRAGCADQGSVGQAGRQGAETVPATTWAVLWSPSVTRDQPSSATSR